MARMYRRRWLCHWGCTLAAVIGVTMPFGVRSMVVGGGVGFFVK
jgi:hypothetical protein